MWLVLTRTTGDVPAHVNMELATWMCACVMATEIVFGKAVYSPRQGDARRNPGPHEVSDVRSSSSIGCRNIGLLGELDHFALGLARANAHHLCGRVSVALARFWRSSGKIDDHARHRRADQT